MIQKPKIVAHCLIKNEERWVWYSINSVIGYVDEIMVWDTGSTDNTVQVIKSISNKKVKFKSVQMKNAIEFTNLRQKMIENTNSKFTWIMILDGDEVWPRASIKVATEFARSHPSFESIVVKTHNLVGDIYHCLPDSAGHYHLAGAAGHLNLRFMNIKTIPGLHADKPHGQQGYFDSNNNLIQNRNPKEIKLINVHYHHATHLLRSISTIGDSQVIKRSQKLKYEIGEPISDAEIPEIFFSPRPKFVQDVTMRASAMFWIKSSLLTIPRRIKRRLFPPPHGY